MSKKRKLTPRWPAPERERREPKAARFWRLSDRLVSGR